jgi:hypothetical protein
LHSRARSLSRSKQDSAEPYAPAGIGLKQTFMEPTRPATRPTSLPTDTVDLATPFSTHGQLRGEGRKKGKPATQFYIATPIPPRPVISQGIFSRRVSTGSEHKPKRQHVWPLPQPVTSLNIESTIQFHPPARYKRAWKQAFVLRESTVCRHPRIACGQQGGYTPELGWSTEVSAEHVVA